MDCHALLLEVSMNICREGDSRARASSCVPASTIKHRFSTTSLALQVLGLMALLLSKISMLPIVGRNASRSVMAAYFSNTPPAFRRNTPTIVNDDDDTTTDEDEIMNVDQESVVAVTDNGNVIQPVACRVSLPPRRRPWATMQDETALRFRLDMPGIPKDAVKVYIDDARLVVKGKYPPLEEVVDEDHILADNVGMYSAEIELPDNVKTKEIKSEMKDGMLLVTAPKEVLFIPVE